MRNASERETGASTGIAPSALEGYFKSIEEPFRETRSGLAREDRPIGVFVLCFVFSLIPVIPYLLSKIAFLLFGARTIGVRTFHFHLASFWFWWVASFLISLSLLAIVGKFVGPSAEERKRWLSPQQMRFAYCYAALDEIRKYRTNQRSAHIEAALDDLNKIGTSLIRASTLDLAAGVHPDQHWQREIQLSEARVSGIRSLGCRADRPKWYRLQP